MKKVARLKSLFNKGFSPFFYKAKKTLIFFKKSVDICFKVLYNNLRCQATTTQYGSLAQLAEHLTFNQGVRGSNPRWLTRKVIQKRSPAKKPDKIGLFGVFGEKSSG